MRIAAATALLLGLATPGPGVGITYDLEAALCGMAPGAGDLVVVLKPLLRDKRPHIRDNAVKALGCVGGPAKAVEKEIRLLLNDPDANVRSSAIRTLKLLLLEIP